MYKCSTLGGVAAVILSLSLSACSGSGAGAAERAAPAATPSATSSTTATDGIEAFVEAARDRVPMINSSTDEEIARIGRDICNPSSSMSAANADEMSKSMLVLAYHARNDEEAEVIVGLAKQHMCRPS